MSLTREDWNDVSQLQTKSELPVRSAYVYESTEGPRYSYVMVFVEGLKAPYRVKIDGTIDETNWRIGMGAVTDKLLEIIKKPTTKEPDGPPRDWPAIWRKQLREHIERAPMIPQIFIDEVLDYYDEAVLRRNTFEDSV